VKTALGTLDALEQDHRRPDSRHAKVDVLGKQCLHEGHLSLEEAQQFREAVAELASIYKQHIRIEDEVIFPVAARTLSESDKSRIAAEMSVRRSVAVRAELGRTK
jgi:hemerythrin-like domain-containing protein